MNMYQELCTKFYDLDKPEPPQEELNFYLKYIEKAHEPILEPMSGSGRFLIPLLEMGYSVEGIDASTSMLSACKQKMEEKGVNTKLYKQFLDKIELSYKYGLIFIPSGSFGLIIEDKEIQNSLKKIYYYLKPGGKFIVEVETPEVKPDKLGQVYRKVQEKQDGSKLVMTCFCNSYIKEKRILQNINKYELYQDGKLKEKELEEFNLKLYNREDFKDLLLQTGFTNVKKIKSKLNDNEKEVSTIFEGEK
ncbi:MAG: class I SAM-dependent methyltransferase [Bacillota bacterium]